MIKIEYRCQLIFSINSLYFVKIIVMISQRFLIWIFILNIPFLNYCLSQDRIVLKNNNTLSGKIIEYQQDTIILKSEYGNLRIPRTDVLRIDFYQTVQQPNDTI